MAQWQPGRTVEFVEESLSATQETERFKGNRTREPRRGRHAFSCPRCGIHTFGGKEYCTNCGFHLKATCRDCGMEWRCALQYAFCPECGGALGSGEESEVEGAQRGAAGFVLEKKETSKKGEGS